MKLKSRKGSAMVEATMIFSLTIVAVMAVLYIIMGLFVSLQVQTDLHLDIRNQAGILSKTVEREETIIDTEVDRGYVDLRPIIKGEKRKTHGKNSLILKDIEKTEKGRAYVIRETELVRRVNLAKEILP